MYAFPAMPHVLLSSDVNNGSLPRTGKGMARYAAAFMLPSVDLFIIKYQVCKYFLWFAPQTRVHSYTKTGHVVWEQYISE